MLYDRILNENEQINAQLATLEKEINSLPEGKLICAINGKHYKWYFSDRHQCTYLPKSNLALAQKLARKKYLYYQIDDLKQQKKALEKYLENYIPASNRAEKLLTEHPEFHRLLSPYFQPLSQNLSDWSKTSYPSNPNYSEHLIHTTLSGHKVRSKSEALIANILYQYQIPFRYECELNLDSTIIYPDFTIRHPRTGEYYYWEHFGIADKHNYSQKIGSRLQLYISNKIIPTIHLITTFETKENPLCSDTIENIIKEYFL